jgi:hypothetical protein
MLEGSMRTIEIIEFRDVTQNGEDGFSAQLHVRISPSRSVHQFDLSLSGTVASPLGLQRKDRDRAMAAMFAGAQKKILQDPRHEFPAEENMPLDKRDVEPFILT